MRCSIPPEITRIFAPPPPHVLSGGTWVTDALGNRNRHAFASLPHPWWPFRDTRQLGRIPRKQAQAWAIFANCTYAHWIRHHIHARSNTRITHALTLADYRIIVSALFRWRSFDRGSIVSKSAVRILHAS